MSIGPESPKMTQLLDQSNGLHIAVTAGYFRIYAMVRLAHIATILDHLTGAVVDRDFAAACGKITLNAKTRNALREFAESKAAAEVLPQAVANLPKAAKTRESATKKLPVKQRKVK
jgi:hypothetical protein